VNPRAYHLLLVCHHPAGALQVKNAQVVCHPMSTESAPESECEVSSYKVDANNQQVQTSTCTVLRNIFTIGTRDDVTEVADFGFANFGGTIHIAGDFKSLTRIGFYAFLGLNQPTEMNFQSTIIFGRGTVLVLFDIRFSSRMYVSPTSVAGFEDRHTCDPTTSLSGGHFLTGTP
jgi:hypothetical protein